jgi:hypothetical protein
MPTDEFYQYLAGFVVNSDGKYFRDKNGIYRWTASSRSLVSSVLPCLVVKGKVA